MSNVKRDWRATIRSPWFWRGFFDEMLRGSLYILGGAMVGGLIVYRICHHVP